MTEPDTGFNTLFRETVDPAVVVDLADLTVLAANPAFCHLLKIEAESVVGKVGNALVTNIPNFLASPSTVFESELKCLDGVPITTTIHASQCAWNGVSAALLIARPHKSESLQTSKSNSGQEPVQFLLDAAAQLEVINRVIAAVNSSRTIEQVFDLASAEMQSLFSSDRASIALIEPDGEHLRVFAVSGRQPGSQSIGAVGLVHGSVTELALEERRPIVIADLVKENRFNSYQDLQQEGFNSAVCCPLFSNGRAIGSLNLTCHEPLANERKHLLALTRLAPPLAIAIEKVLLLQQADARSNEMDSAAKREELAGSIGRQLTGSLDPSLIMQEAVDALGVAIEAPRVHLSLIDSHEPFVFVRYEFLADKRVPSVKGHRLPFNSSTFASRSLFADGCTTIDISENAQNDELLNLYRRLGALSIAVAPLTVGGQRLGLIEVHDIDRNRRWTSAELRLLEAVASEMSVALTNAQLYESSRLRSEEFEGLYRISRVFSTLRDTSAIFEKLTRAVAELVGGDMCLIATYDRRLNQMRAESPAFNVHPAVVKEFRFTLERDDETSLVHRSGKPFYSNDPANDQRFSPNFVKRYGVRSALGLPMMVKGELVGFIYVANKPGGFGNQDVRMLEIFAAQATETITNARLFATMEAQAEREAIVNRMLLSMQQTSDAGQAVDMVVERLASVLDVDRCTAVLFADKDREEFRGEWCAPGVPRINDDREVHETSPIPEWLRTYRRPLVASNAQQHSLARGLEHLVERMQLKSIVVVPIFYKGKVVGALSAQQTRSFRDWGEDDVDLLTAVAAHVGALLENAHLITELRNASKIKDEFLAVVSHELRTPLTAIRGWVELLAESPAIRDDEELNEGVDVIKHSALSLSQLISDLLDLSRIHRKALILERRMSDVNAAILEAFQIVRRSAISRRVTVHLELEENLPEAYVDSTRLQQIFWNLLTNAIKFTPANGTVTIRSRTVDSSAVVPNGDNDQRWISVEVEDSGEGIPAAFLPHVWERFRQADASHTRRHNGLGIGLTLVKELAEAHGGMVDAKSEGIGALFEVRFPVNPPDQP
ncbi:MAG: hypothetical protein QOH96_3565 [Blastocatellia bacterium]|nr:hypothetical protein [Blastocatellia bacterium]